MTQDTEETGAADVLAKVGKADARMGATEYDPMEKIPTLAVGDDIKPGQLIVGIFQETQRLVSPKFKMSREKDAETGLPVQYLHVLSNNGSKFGIWNCGELKQGFGKLASGDYVELTYIEKGVVNGQAQHRFSWKVKRANVQ